MATLSLRTKSIFELRNPKRRGGHGVPRLQNNKPFLSIAK